MTLDDTIQAGPDGLVAVLLAGGRGTRLGALTEHESKPAIELFSGTRIVDFVMANALRSGVQTLLVCTQWQPDTLVAHLRDNWAAGFPGGMVFRNGTAVAGPDGYTGTAHAVACNAAELDAAGTREVLVLAGDHVYDMDYREMLAAHRAIGLPVTVATLPVPRTEARGFGVFETDGPCHARRFLEKPDDPPPMYGHPDRAMISMGIYVFDWAWLRATLVPDEAALHSAADAVPVDFGHDLLPRAVERREVGVFCYSAGDAGQTPYWRDVGTVQSLQAARADLSHADRPIPLPRFPAATEPSDRATEPDTV